jgi:hypothetical protein
MIGKTYLINGGLDLGRGEDLLELHLGEVGYADGPYLPGLIQILHLLPGILDIPGAEHVTCPIRKSGEFGVVPIRVQLKIGPSEAPNIRDKANYRDRPVHEVD